MQNRFLRHVESWLPQVLRQKAVATAEEQRLCFIGASDLAMMIADYVLTTLGEDAETGWSAGEIDLVSDDELCAATGLSREAVAVGFIGAVVELVPWHGAAGRRFLIGNGVPRDAAVEFVNAIELASEKVGDRGRVILTELDQVVAPPPGQFAYAGE